MDRREFAVAGQGKDKKEQPPVPNIPIPGSQRQPAVLPACQIIAPLPASQGNGVRFLDLSPLVWLAEVGCARGQPW